MSAATSVCALIMLAFVVAAPFADAAEIRVFSTGAPAEAAKTIAADFLKGSGHRMALTVEQPVRIRRRLVDGQHADVVILPSPDIAVLSASGVLRADSTVNLARVGIGVVVRAGSSAPDISNAAAVRKLLLDARSIVYSDPLSGGGYTGRAIARMVAAMGITEAIQQKLTLKSAIGGGVDLVAEGKVEVGLFNISEILPIKGVTLVGPLPPELQNYIVFTAAIPVTNTTPEPAVSFIKALAAPAARQAWRDAGLEPLAAAP